MLHTFETVHAFTARWEGGLSDHPADPGGITNHGVSLRWLKELAAEQGEREHDFNGDGRVDAEDIRHCTAARAAALMRKNFWEPLRCGQLPVALAAVLYDAAVNCGPARAVRLLQASCNVVAEAHLDAFTPLREDGVCGPLTVACCRALAEAGLDFYTARHCLRARERFYVELARKREDLRPFLAGWRNRCAALLHVLGQLEREA